MIGADGLWSFVGDRGRAAWVWAALDLGTRQVVAMVVGDRPEATARRLWDGLPAAYREGAVFGTDLWPSYLGVVPEGRHAGGDRVAGLTCRVERFRLTLRQRCGRFVRRSLPFSKCPRDHLGALWYFIRLYNRTQRCRPQGHYRESFVGSTVSAESPTPSLSKSMLIAVPVSERRQLAAGGSCKAP